MDGEEAYITGNFNPQIEELELLGRRNGAMAAKVSGAGGGGFMMFVVPSETALSTDHGVE